MKRKVVLLLLCSILVFISSGCKSQLEKKGSEASNQFRLSDNKEIARMFLQSLNNDNYIEPHFYISNGLKKQITEKVLHDVWKDITTKAGKLDTIFNIYSVNHEVGELIFQDCRFDTTYLSFQLTFNKKNEVIGMYFKPLSADVINSLKK
jgi:hypothetical protein